MNTVKQAITTKLTPELIAEFLADGTFVKCDWPRCRGQGCARCNWNGFVGNDHLHSYTAGIFFTPGKKRCKVSKITDGQIRTMMADYRENFLTWDEMALKYHMGKNTVGKLLREHLRGKV